MPTALWPTNCNPFAFDEYVFSFDAKEGMTIWEVQSGERMAQEQGFCPAGYHRNGKHFLSVKEDGTVHVSRLASQ